MYVVIVAVGFPDSFTERKTVSLDQIGNRGI